MEVFDEQDSPFKHCSLPHILGQYWVIEGAWVLSWVSFSSCCYGCNSSFYSRLLLVSLLGSSFRLRGQVTRITLPPVAHQWFPHPLSSLSGCRPSPQKVAVMSCPVVDHRPCIIPYFFFAQSPPGSILGSSKKVLSPKFMSQFVSSKAYFATQIPELDELFVLEK